MTTTATQYLDQLILLEQLGADLTAIPGRARLEQIVDRQHEVAAHRAATFNTHQAHRSEAARTAAEGGDLDHLIAAAQRATVTVNPHGELGHLYNAVNAQLDAAATAALAAPEAVWLDALRPLVVARVAEIRSDIPAGLVAALVPAANNADGHRTNLSLLAGRESATRAHAELRQVYTFAQQLRATSAIPGNQFPAEAFEWRASLAELGRTDDTLATFILHMANGYEPALLTAAEVAAYDSAVPSSRVDMTRLRAEADKAQSAGGMSFEAAARF